MGLVPAQIFHGLDTLSDRPLIAAVSGGSDSLALLLLTDAFLKSIPSRPPLIAVTVDHRLRAQSADEARAVGDLCRRRGISHRIMTWDGDKPATGLPAAAREARYQLLSQAALETGANIILTGHTMDDQAETISMRRARRSMGPGLAGMACSTLFDERVWIVRPLLSSRRRTLRAYLSSHGVEWAEDATNENHAFERARVRAGLRDAEIEELAASALREGEARRLLARQVAHLTHSHLSMPAPGLLRLNVDVFRKSDLAGLHLFRILLAIAGGKDHLPDVERAAALFPLLAGHSFRATLSRAVVEARGGSVWIRREARDVPKLALSSGALLWDGRWRIEAERVGHGEFFIGALGAAAVTRLAGPEADGIPPRLARAAISLEPWLFDRGDPIGPAGGAQARDRGISARPVPAPLSRVLPDFDVETANALRERLNLGVLPASPWRNHIDA